MISALSALQPTELVILLIAISGVLPVFLYRRQLSSWLLIAYLFLCIGAVMTNIEHLLWPDVLNFIEHSVGNLGAGISFAIIGYLHRERILMTKASESTSEDA